MIGAMRATIADYLRAMLDYTPQEGVIEHADDSGFSVMEKPIDRLHRRAHKLGASVYDFRQTPRTERQKRGRARGTRRLGDVDTILFHQMAAIIHDPWRCLSIPAHGAIVRGGDIVLLQPIQAYMWHAHAANKFSVGIEISARAAGIVGNPATFWRSKREKGKGLEHEDLVQEATNLQLHAANILADYYIDEITRRRGVVRYVMDHRNSARKTSDPGQRIHQGVTLATRERNHLEHREPVGSGLPNPTVWSGAPGVPYSWKVER